MTVRLTPRRRDAAIMGALFVAAFMTCRAYVQAVVAGGGRPEFYQSEFGPAVALACGRGYVAPDPAELPTLRRFLDTQADTFNCGDLPPNPRLSGLTGAQTNWQYLIALCGWYWRVAGVSWIGLASVGGLMFGASVVLAYALLRMVCGAWLSTAGAAMVLTSPLHLSELPNLRDYSKAPFMLALGLILAWTMAPGARTRRLLMLGGLYGLVLGAGLGFRNDLLITIPAFVLVVAVAGDGFASQLAVKAGALALAAVVFLATARPILTVYSEGGGASMQHVALLGLARPFDRPLGVSSPDTYQLIETYSDSYVAAVVIDYGRRALGIDAPVHVYDGQYDRAATALGRDVVTTFPADLLVRAYASTLKVTGLPLSSAPETNGPPFVAGAVQRFYLRRAALLERLPPLWSVSVAAALLLASASDVRLAALLTLLLLYFGGYPAIQFHERHYFHLNLIPIVAVAYLLARIGRAARGPRPSWPVVRGGLVRMASFGLVAIAALLAPLIALRMHQDAAVQRALAARLQLPREPVALAERALPDGRVGLDLSSPPADAEAHRHHQTVRSEYLLLEFPAAQCDESRVQLAIRYDGNGLASEFERTIPLAIPLETAQTLRVLVPAYYFIAAAPPGAAAVSMTFRGFELNAAERACLGGAFRLTGLDRVSMLLAATLPPGWETQPLHQTLQDWEHPRAANVLHVYSVPPDMHVTRSTLTAPLARPPATDLADRASGVVVNDAQWAVDGTTGIGGTGRFRYLAVFKPHHVGAGDRFVASGTLRRGGLSIGLIDRDGWLAQATVTEPGPFLVVVESPRGADASLVVANNIAGWSLHNQFTIDRAGWIVRSGGQ